MTSSYREIRPSPTLAPFVECFWVSEISDSHCAHVLPDGCADILFFTRGNQLQKAEVVGVMTRPHQVALDAGQTLLGVRFHPGMAGACLPCDLPALNDRSVPIEVVLGGASHRMTQGVFHHASPERRVEALEDRLACLPTMTNVQRAIGSLVDRQGQLSLDDFAEAAGVGPRQLRRACLNHSGLPPKQLARILRFRRAIRMLREDGRDMAGIALACGYFDQPHMIRDFREFAGLSPARYLRRLQA